MKTRPQIKFLLLVTSALASAVAHAQSENSAVAQALFDQAKQLMANDRTAEACPKLEESQRLEPRSGTLINLASCYEQTGRLASAWSTYIEAATAARASGNSEREAVARGSAAALLPRLSKLTIVVAPALVSVPGLEIKRDGVVVREPEWGIALPSNSGVHQVTANAPGHVPFSTQVSVQGEASIATVNVPELAVSKTASPQAAATTLASASTASQDFGTQRSLALVAGGVGVVGIGLGAAFGLASKSKHDQAAEACDGASCPDNAGLAAANAARTDGNISTVMMLVGVAGLATGITLWVTAPKAGDARSARVALGFGALHVKAAF